MTDDTYNGYSNRETWAFNLHWQNDQGLYNMVLEYAADVMADLDGDGNDLDRGDGYDSSVTDYGLGERVVEYVKELLEEHMTGVPTDGTDMMYREVGSWWRIDYAEVGAAVRESLDAES